MTSAISAWGRILAQIFRYITGNSLLGASVFAILIIMAINAITIVYKNASKVKK